MISLELVKTFPVDENSFSYTSQMQPCTLQTQHVNSTLKRRGNGRFHVVLTWNPRGVFVG